MLRGLEERTIEVVIVAYGFEYLVMAVNAARSIRRTNPSLAITLVTNAPAEWTALEQEFDRVVFREEDATLNRYAKIRSHHTTTADRVLYLDADSEILGDLTPAFDLLAEFDVLLRPFDLPGKFAFDLLPGIDGRLFPQFWGGGIFYRRSPAAIALLERWEDRYSASGLARDQPALARAVLDTQGVRILPMNAVWGAFSGDAARPPDWPKRPSPVIYHYADVSNDPAVLARCAAVLDDLLRRLPPSASDAEEVRATVRRFARLRSRRYQNRATRRLTLRWWLLRDRMGGLDARTARKKRPQGSGRSLTNEHQVIWDD